MRYLIPYSCPALCLAIVVLLAPSPCLAHGGRTAGPVEGISISSLTHGQMAVLADYHEEILDLAARRGATDEPFRRVLNYTQIQYAFCMWGLAPRSIADERSPFNECSHAYLAATRDVLLRMREMPGSHAHVEALASRIDADMVRNRASLVLCQFSGEAFDTASMIYPDWRGIFTHLPSLAAFAGLGLFAAGGIFAAMRVTRPVQSGRAGTLRRKI